MLMKNANNPTNSTKIASVHSAYSGPIPDPHSLEKYENIHPGFADRIITMAENEAKHRHEVEIMLVRKDSRISAMGVVFAFFSVIMFCLLIFYALYKGNNMETLAVAIGAIASVAGIFVFVRSRKNKN